MENHATPETPPNSIPSPPAKTRRVRRLVIWTLVAMFVVATVGFFLVHRGGTSGKVQTVLAGVRAEEKRSANSTWRRNFLLRTATDLLDQVLPSRQWKGDYFYREQLVALGTNAAPELLRVMESDLSEAARKVSAMALGELPASGVLPGLVKALNTDKKESVRQAAVESLASLGDTNAVPVLLAALRSDQDDNVRAECARVLGGLGGQAIVPELIAVAAKETNAPVRVGLAGTLGQLQDQRSVRLLVAWLQTPRQVAPQPTNGVWAPDNVFADDGSGNHDVQVVSAAATALGNVGGEDAFNGLMSQWGRETNGEVRRCICEALGIIGDSRALPVLLSALRDGGELKTSLVEALGNLGDTNAVADLLPLLGDGDKEVRQKAAAALGLIGSRESLPELVRLADEDFAAEVRVSACAALGMIGNCKSQEVIVRALPQLGENRQEAVWALGHVGDSNAIPALTGLFDDKERETRFSAAYALVEIGGPAAADALAAHLEDKDDYARHGKACALAMLGRTNSLNAVRSSLRSKEMWQRFGAALALIRLGKAVPVKEWEPMLTDTSPALRVLASESAAGRAMPALTTALRDRDKDIRHYAARGLIFFKDASTLPALREACRDSNPEVRNAARVAVRCLDRSSNKGD